VSLEIRAERLRNRLEELEADSVILSAPANVRYITGFSGEGWAIVDSQTTLITDSRYELRAKDESPDAELIVRTGSMKGPVAEYLASCGAERVGFEADHLTVSQRDEMAEELGEIELVPLKSLLRVPRMTKDGEELAILRRAIAVTDEAFARVAEWLEPGINEKELALEIERQVLLAGGDKLSFDTIAASGPNAAHPHAEPSDRKLRGGDVVKLDFGACVDGYHADMTRTLLLGDPTDKQREVYGIVLEAQTRAIEACCAGMGGKELDGVAREVVKAAGYGDSFGHGLGHGVGLEVHEGPAVSQTSEDTLEAGMTVTIEPGIYLEGWGGVRIEDIVLVTEDGCEVLTGAPKLHFD
jgi:Xaa-Pro aminopeptidase